MRTNHNRITVKTKADRIVEREIGRFQSSGSIDDSDEVYEVEAIMKKRVRGGVDQYLVKWKGYPQSQSTWQPKENMTNCASIILEFELAQLPPSAREDLTETQEPFRPSTDPLPPSLYEHNLNAIRPDYSLTSCRTQLAFLRDKIEKEASLIDEEVMEILLCERDRKENTIWFGVRLKDGSIRRVRKEELMKHNKRKLVQYYEQLIRWST